jgi:DNA topoisomerase-1
MKNKHVTVEGTRITFAFRGKKGVNHVIGLKSRKLANIIKACQDIPGKELFEYIDADGCVHKVDSGMVNDYIRAVSGGEFSAKDFRTWSGSVAALTGFREAGGFTSAAEMNKKIPQVMDYVARQLGNTRTVCRKYYVHPRIVDLYQAQKLETFLSLPAQETQDNGLSPEESILMQILQQA